MKLVFKKDDDNQISVLQKVDEGETDFSYVEMIKTLLVDREMEEPETSGDFSDDEINSIRSMVSYINDEIPPVDDPPEPRLS